MDDSILTTIKSSLDVPEDVAAYDTELIMFINTAFLTLYQLGVGPSTCYHIQDSSNVWSEFVGDSEKMEAVKTYISLSTKLLFDSKNLSSAVIQIIKEKLTELEVRLSYMFDPIEGNVL